MANDEKALITESYLYDIADAIRTKNGRLWETYKPAEMSAAIRAIPATLVRKTITQNGIYNPADDNADGYSEVKVSVSVSGVSVLYGTDTPTSADGQDGDIYIRYHIEELVILRVTGGYNGGATVTLEIGGVVIFTATASDTYNLNYNKTQEDIETNIGTISVSITPPTSSTGQLYIEVAWSSNSITKNPPMMGPNTSYGYGQYSSDIYITIPPGNIIIDEFFLKDNDIWKGVNDMV